MLAQIYFLIVLLIMFISILYRGLYIKIIVANRGCNKCYLRTLQWLIDQNPFCPWSASICYAAASSFHLDILKWPRNQEPPCPWDFQSCVQAAVTEGHHQRIYGWIEEVYI